MNDGYIKFFRKFTKWEWYHDANTKALFIHLLLTANFEEKEWNGITIKRGQLVTSRKKLAKALGLTEREIRTSLNHLKSTNNLTIKTTSRYSLITVVNWAKYQVSIFKNDQVNDQQNDQRKKEKTTTTKERYNNKEIKEYILSSKLDDTPSIFSEIISCFNKVGIKEDSFTKNKVEFHFKNSESNRELIQGVLDKGYTKEDIFDVVYLKYDQWIENNDKNKKDMSTYYRPSTILGEKFDEYFEEAKMKGIS